MLLHFTRLFCAFFCASAPRTTVQVTAAAVPDRQRLPCPFPPPYPSPTRPLVTASGCPLLGPPNAQSVATQFDFVASWLVAVAIHLPTAPPPSHTHSRPPHRGCTPPLHGLCGNSVHRLAAIKCTCRFVFAVTFIRRYSAFFLQPMPGRIAHTPSGP